MCPSVGLNFVPVSSPHSFPLPDTWQDAKVQRMQHVDYSQLRGTLTVEVILVPE